MKKIGIIFNQSAGSFKRLNRNPKEWIEEIISKHSVEDAEFDIRYGISIIVILKPALSPHAGR